MGDSQPLLLARGPSRYPQGSQAQQPGSLWDPGLPGTRCLGALPWETSCSSKVKVHGDSGPRASRAATLPGEDCSGVDESVSSPEEGAGCGHRGRAQAGHGPLLPRHPSSLSVTAVALGLRVLPAGAGTPPLWEPKILPWRLPHSRG